MKKLKTLILFISVFILFGCNKDNTVDPINNNEEQVIFYEDLTLNKSKEFIPSFYSTASFVNYTNENGDQLKFSINEVIFTIPYAAFLDRNEYETENITYLLTPPDEDNNVSLNLAANIKYDNKNDIRENVSALLKTPLTDEESGPRVGFLFINDIFQEQDANDYFIELKLGNKVFKDVYTNKAIINEDQFSNIYTNKEIGIVAFLDRSNNLWYYDSHE